MYESKTARFFTVPGVLLLLLVSPCLAMASVPNQSSPLALIQNGTQKALEDFAPVGNRPGCSFAAEKR